MFAEDFVIDASGSYIKNIDMNDINSENLQYVWTCPENLTNLCLEIGPVLTINYSSYLEAQGPLNLAQEIILAFHWLHDDGSVSTASESFQVTWTDIKFPKFTISEPMKVLATGENKWTLTLENYNSGDS